MKNTILLSLVILAMVVAGGCNKKTRSNTDIAKEKEAIKLVLEKYALANENQDMALIEDIWYPSEHIVSFGTESDEKLVGWDEIKRAVEKQFQNFSNTYISYHDQIIEVNDEGNTAWFSEIMNYNFILNGEAHSYEGLRYTGVLVKKDGKWKLVQTHISIPAQPES